jgi:quinolinate synthase
MLQTQNLSSMTVVRTGDQYSITIALILKQVSNHVDTRAWMLATNYGLLECMLRIGESKLVVVGDNDRCICQCMAKQFT